MLQINVYYECDMCHEVEEIKIFDVEFYYDYSIYPEGIELEEAKTKWHDNALYPFNGNNYEWKDGDYDLLCDKCYNQLKIEYMQEKGLYPSLDK
jgi:hypothetical protein